MEQEVLELLESLEGQVALAAEEAPKQEEQEIHHQQVQHKACQVGHQLPRQVPQTQILVEEAEELL